MSFLFTTHYGRVGSTSEKQHVETLQACQKHTMSTSSQILSHYQSWSCAGSIAYQLPFTIQANKMQPTSAHHAGKAPSDELMKPAGKKGSMESF